MLKSLDFYRKIQSEQQVSSSMGGLYTLISLVIATLLMLYSIQDYSQQQYYTFLTIENDNSDQLAVAIDVLFNRMPCEAIQIVFKDKIDFVAQGLEKNLTMTKITPDGTQQPYVRTINTEEQKKKLVEGLMGQKKCRIQGSFYIPKTPGSFIFEPSASQNVFDRVGLIGQKSRMSYKLYRLQFGQQDNYFDFPISHQSQSIGKYIRQLEGDIRTRQYVQDYTEVVEEKIFLSQIKIIPMRLETKLGNESVKEGNKYRYSIRSTGANVFGEKMQAKFGTQIEPINIVYRRQYHTVYELLVSMLAIVGGAMATIGIMNRISHYILSI